MASNVELIIFDGESLNAALPAGAAVVQLSRGLGGIPVTAELLAGLAADADVDRVHPGWILKQRVCGLAQDLSARRRVLYVAGETFGSICCQEAVGWLDARLVYGPSGTCDNENDREEGYRAEVRRQQACSASMASNRATALTTSPARTLTPKAQRAPLLAQMPLG